MESTKVGASPDSDLDSSSVDSDSNRTVFLVTLQKRDIEKKKKVNVFG